MNQQAQTGGGETEAPPSPIVVDLSKDSAEQALSKEITQPTIEPPQREKTRTVLAMAVVFSLPGIVLVMLAALIAQRVTAADLKEVGTIFFTPLVGIAGAVLGFYFGERRR